MIRTYLRILCFHIRLLSNIVLYLEDVFSFVKIITAVAGQQMTGFSID